MMDSALYVGTLRHRRFRPVHHEFSYHVFMAMLDIDRIPEVLSRSPFSSHNRFNWATFRDGDHMAAARAGNLRERLTADADAQGVTLPAGPIYLLTNLRYLGYNFNPISLYYCFEGPESGHNPPRVILAEVNSTFGETHNYWLDARKRAEIPGPLRFRSTKTMHVSPFMPMNLEYAFALTPPGESLVAHIATLDNREATAGPLFDATLTLERRPWTAAELHRALLRHPWMTARVIGAIHWEALRLWIKGAPFFPHPAAGGSR
jgi:DUF1365 family protein